MASRETSYEMTGFPITLSTPLWVYAVMSNTVVRLRKEDHRAMLGFEQWGDDEQNTYQSRSTTRVLSAPIKGYWAAVALNIDTDHTNHRTENWKTRAPIPDIYTSNWAPCWKNLEGWSISIMGRIIYRECEVRKSVAKQKDKRTFRQDDQTAALWSSSVCCLNDVN